jgi:hypothetical protein
MERGWITEISAMVMPPGRARRMSPRAWTRVLAPEAEMPAPPASPGRRRRAGSWVEVMPALCTTRQYPFQDVMAQRGMCSKGRAPHPMVDIGRAEGRATVALHGRGVGGQHADAKTVAEAGAPPPYCPLNSERLMRAQPPVQRSMISQL